MPRYFIEISYKGTAYSGFQVQKNANSIQAEIEKALSVFFKKSFSLTGSSRTDAGVHALQNYFRFDAVSRQYKYFIFREKNPFLQDRAFYYPYKIDINRLNEAAEMVLLTKDFTTFSKRNTQVKHFLCDIKKSFWIEENDMLVYSVESNRFLRGMVKGLVGTMLRIATHKISLEEFNQIIQDKDCRKADFSVPSHGLFLIKVTYDRI